MRERHSEYAILVHLRLALALSASSFVIISASPAGACGSCRGPGGAGSALTAPGQTWGASLAQTMRLGHGVFDTGGRYRGFGPSSYDRVMEVAGALSYRPFEVLEVEATSAFGHVAVGGPSFHSDRAALGDLGLRVRWEALVEPAIDLPHGSRRPSLGVTLSVRLPTGGVDRSGDVGAGPSAGTVGSTATSQGLGTTEVALAIDVRKTFAQRYQLGAVMEGAWRAPDDSVGLRRALGPRGLLRVMGIVFEGDVTFGAFVDLAAETDVSYGGRLSTLSAQRSCSVGLSASLKTDVGFRSGLALAYQPALEGIAMNAVAAVAFTAFFAFTK